VNGLQPAELAPGIVGARLAIRIGAAEQTRQALQALGVGSGLVDLFEDAPVVGQDFASRPAATLRSVIERCRFILPVRRLKSRQRYF
jgi:hypothetical protein